MRIFHWLLIGAVLAIVLTFSFFIKIRKDDNIHQRLKTLESARDSLQHQIIKIRQDTYERDSLMASYIKTLNSTLEELDKEQKKNKQLIEANELIQAETLKEFCERMRNLNKPTFCD